MSEKTVSIEIVWRNYGEPIAPAQTGEVEVPVVVIDVVSNKPRLSIARYLDNGTWIDPSTGEEMEDDILAWGNIEAHEILFKMGLKDWQVRAEKALEGKLD